MKQINAYDELAKMFSTDRHTVKRDFYLTVVSRNYPTPIYAKPAAWSGACKLAFAVIAHQHG